MSVAKVIEIISSSKKSFEDAVAQGVIKAADSLHNITGAWVKDQSVKVVNGKVTEFRVVMKLTFVLKEKVVKTAARTTMITAKISPVKKAKKK